jgi:hypothetical protein
MTRSRTLFCCQCTGRGADCKSRSRTRRPTRVSTEGPSTRPRLPDKPEIGENRDDPHRSLWHQGNERSLFTHNPNRRCEVRQCRLSVERTRSVRRGRMCPPRGRKNAAGFRDSVRGRRGGDGAVQEQPSRPDVVMIRCRLTRGEAAVNSASAVRSTTRARPPVCGTLAAGGCCPRPSNIPRSRMSHVRIGLASPEDVRVVLR